MTGCFLALYGVMERGGMTPCEGRLRQCHLIPRQLLKREGLQNFLWNPRVWVLGCGGPTGLAGHHGAFDTARTLRLPREAIPWITEEFADEHGLTWWLDREYGERRAAA